MPLSWPRPIVIATLCALALGQVPGCSTPAGPTTGPCVEETVWSGQTPIPASTYQVQRLTTTQTGRVVLVVDWGSPVNLIRTVLAQAPCSLEQFHDDHCNVILDLFSPPKPLGGSTYWLPPGPYDLIIGNFGVVAETTTTKVVLRSTGCPAPGNE